MKRLSWDQVWGDIARTMALRSACQRTQVGTVIVTAENRVVATGYNGPPAGSMSTCERYCPRNLKQEGTAGFGNCIAIHAEANALMFCDRKEREGGTMFTTRVPCNDCAKLIANSGLVEVVIVGAITKKDEHLNAGQSVNTLEEAGMRWRLL